MKLSGQVESESKDLANPSACVRVSAMGFVDSAVSGSSSPSARRTNCWTKNALAVSDHAEVVTRARRDQPSLAVIWNVLGHRAPVQKWKRPPTKAALLQA